MTTEWKEIRRLKLTEVVPKPKPRTTFRSYIHPEGTSKKTGGESQFDPAMRQPTKREKPESS